MCDEWYSESMDVPYLQQVMQLIGKDKVRVWTTGVIHDQAKQSQKRDLRIFVNGGLENFDIITEKIGNEEDWLTNNIMKKLRQQIIVPNNGGFLFKHNGSYKELNLSKAHLDFYWPQIEGGVRDSKYQSVPFTIIDLTLKNEKEGFHLVRTYYERTLSPVAHNMSTFYYTIRGIKGIIRRIEKQIEKVKASNLFGTEIKDFEKYFNMIKNKDVNTSYELVVMANIERDLRLMKGVNYLTQEMFNLATPNPGECIAIPFDLPPDTDDLTGEIMLEANKDLSEFYRRSGLSPDQDTIVEELIKKSSERLKDKDLEAFDNIERIFEN